MSKLVDVHEACVITKDDKGNLSLVGKAKEALTSMSKHKISVSILVCENKKEDVEKFLKENDVPFASIRSKGEESKGEDGKESKADVAVMPGSKVVTLDGDWQWCLAASSNACGVRRRNPRRVNSSAWMPPWTITSSGRSLPRRPLAT